MYFAIYKITVFLTKEAFISVYCVTYSRALNREFFKHPYRVFHNHAPDTILMYVYQPTTAPTRILLYNVFVFSQWVKSNNSVVLGIKLRKQIVSYTQAQ